MSIEAKELRIGNYVSEDYGGIYEVININSEGFDYLDLRKPTFKALGRYDFSGIKPIPLTEEILFKCGFKKKEDGWFGLKYFTDCELSAEVTDIQINLSSFRCGVADLDNEFHSYAMTGKRIKYLHQLQNLYFALTGSELEVNL